MEVKVKSLSQRLISTRLKKSKVKSKKTLPEANQSSGEEFRTEPWLNPDHPNFERWKRAREISIERGEFVKLLIEKYITCKNLNILDLGSGEGGTSVVFSKFNKVVSFDINLLRLERQNGSYFSKVNGDGKYHPFKKDSFDLIIIQDVVEHISFMQDFLVEAERVLKQGGIIYLSTPNKLSIFNFIADPHWGFPFLSLMKRELIKKFFLNNFRKSEINRKDIPQLLSLKEIEDLLGNKFKMNLETEISLDKLLNGEKGIVWSNFHFSLIKWIKILRLNNLLSLLANNKKGIINNFFTPTFYIILQKIK